MTLQPYRTLIVLLAAQCFGQNRSADLGVAGRTHWRADCAQCEFNDPAAGIYDNRHRGDHCLRLYVYGRSQDRFSVWLRIGGFCVLACCLGRLSAVFLRYFV